MPILTTDRVAFSFITEMQGVKWQNTIYAAPRLDVPTPNENARLDGAFQSMWATIDNFTSNMATFRCGVARVATNESEPVRFFAYTLPGAVAADSHPSTTAIINRHKAIPWDRTKSGRYWWAGIPETFSEDGRLSTVAILAWTDFIAAATSTGWLEGGIFWDAYHYSPKTKIYDKIRKITVDPTLRKLRTRQTDLCTF